MGGTIRCLLVDTVDKAGLGICFVARSKKLNGGCCLEKHTDERERAVCTQILRNFCKVEKDTSEKNQRENGKRRALCSDHAFPYSGAHHLLASIERVSFN